MPFLLCYAGLLLCPMLCTLIAGYGLFNNPSNWKKYLFLYVYVIFILAYSYIPDPNSNLDIVRYFAQLKKIEGLSFQETVRQLNDNLFFENFFFWAVARLKMPHLLPAITTSTMYGVGAYIAFDSAQDDEKKNGWKILLFQLASIHFLTALSICRNVFSFSLAVLAAYLDLYKRKRNVFTVLLYLMAVFMHKTGIIIVAIRFLVPFFKKYSVMAIAIIFSLPIFISFAYKYFYYVPIGGVFGRIIQKLIRSSGNYLKGESEYAMRVRNSLGENVTRYAILFLVVFLVVLYFRKRKVMKATSDFDVLGYLTCIIAIASNAIVTPAYWRFFVAAVIACPGIIRPLYSGILFNKLWTKLIRVALAVYLVFLFALNHYRWGFSFPSADGLYLGLTSNIYTLLFQVLRNILFVSV